MLSVVKMLLKGEVGGHALDSHGNYIVDHVETLNCIVVIRLNTVFTFSLLSQCSQGFIQQFWEKAPSQN